MSDSENAKDEFRWKAIQYLEGRFALMDNKASVVLTLLTAIGLALPLVLSATYEDVKGWVILVALVVYLLVGVAMWLWLLVIRPRWKNEVNKPTAMWLTPATDVKLCKEDYERYMDEHRMALEYSHRILLERAAIKMAHYQRAIKATKIVLPAVVVVTGVAYLLG